MGADATLGWRRWVTTVVVVGAVASPAVLDRNSFPLSTYPIYASERDRDATLHTAVGIATGTGEVRRLSLATIARTDDPLIAESLVSRAVRSGGAEALCEEIARRAPSDVDAIEVVAERHDIVAYTRGDDSLLDRSVKARCEVPR